MWGEDVADSDRGAGDCSGVTLLSPFVALLIPLSGFDALLTALPGFVATVAALPGFVAVLTA